LRERERNVFDFFWKNDRVQKKRKKKKKERALSLFCSPVLLIHHASRRRLLYAVAVVVKVRLVPKSVRLESGADRRSRQRF
jgi:hypothetical protein